MIAEFVSVWDQFKGEVEEKIKASHPSYDALVKFVVEMLHDHIDDYDKPNPAKIHTIDDGHYQGTLLYVIAADTYQPSLYWYVYIGYGSCSGCDTLQSIQDHDERGLDWEDSARDKPSPNQTKEYMTLALHIVQRMKSMNDED